MTARARTIAIAAALLAGCPVTAADPAGRDDKPPFKRLNTASAADLQKELDAVPVVGLGNLAPTVLANYAARIVHDLNQQQMAVGVQDAMPMLEAYPEARTLPLRRGDNCRLTPRAAANLEALSRKLRVYLDRGAPINNKGQRPELGKLQATLRSEVRDKKPEWLVPAAIPTLLQLLMHEDPAVRRMLVDLLAAIDGRAATTALARRAAFDLDPQVREAAVAALRDRPPADGRQELLSLLRYPWPPVADHAAEALVNLNDRDAVPQLVAALNQPDPALPAAGGQGHAVVRELVRVHHLSNCLLCHPPASTGQDPVLGADPIQTLTRPGGGLAQAGRLLQATPGAHSYGQSSGPAPALLRADITYLRQDFSVLQALPPALGSLRSASGPLSAPTQRFDFIVRTRPVSQRVANQSKSSADRVEFPQRTATLYALRELTGRDAGADYASWLKAYPNADDEARALQLSGELCNARPGQRDRLLTRLRDEKGMAYSLALAAAIPNLEGKFQAEARTALVERMARMKLATLKERMREEDPELRRAAIAASGRKRDKTMVVPLINLLEDSDEGVVESARTGLHELTGKSFPTVAEWRAWWDDQNYEGRVK